MNQGQAGLYSEDPGVGSWWPEKELGMASTPEGTKADGMVNISPVPLSSRSSSWAVWACFAESSLSWSCLREAPF